MQVHHLLENTVKKYPEKNAVWFKDKWTNYSEIEENASKICSYLVKNNIKIGDRVAIILENSFDYIAAYFGILKAGGVVVGLNPVLSESFLHFSLSNSDTKLVIFNKKYLSKLSKVFSRIDKTMQYIIDDRDGGENFEKYINIDLTTIYAIEQQTTSIRTIDLDIAEIVYTSGSTGEPKGVTLTHLNLVANQHSIVKYLKLTERDRIMVILPFYYIYGKSLLLTHFLVGGSVVIDNRFTYPNVVLETMSQKKVTGFAGVPSTYSILLSRSNITKKKIESLRYVTQAGGAMAPSLQKKVINTFAPAELYVMYGATEAAPRLSYLEPDMLESKLGSIGKPVDNVDLKILNPDGKEVPIGETGEIAARGSNIMNGYWRDQEATNNAFRNGYYLTGDLGRQDEDGYFFIIGRKKDFIKSKGFKVSAKMIEEAIMEIDGVLEVAVVGVQDEEFGEAIKSFIVKENESGIDTEIIREGLFQKLASNEVPKYIEFVDDLPKNESGKILKTKLQ